ncbi:TIR domain protein [uncultured archaeon]|nr:TIR domain protein [uncultured archaeon]
MLNCKPGDFCDETHYPISLFNLVLNLYAIPLNRPSFEPLRKSLHHQWEMDLAGNMEMIEKDESQSPRVFISYSHRDEEFKEELITMLSGLVRRGVIDTWQDRRIEEGDEWYQEIQKAIKNCDLAVLLISSDFIASRFIQDDELPELLKRRMESGLRVIPVIVRQCLWQSEPVLKDLQALPRDGMPVINFSRENGERDQVWTEIAKSIEEHAK